MPDAWVGVVALRRGIKNGLETGRHSDGESSGMETTCLRFWNGPCLITPMRDESLKFLQKLLNTPSPSGHEARGQRVWLDYAARFAAKTRTDAYGNAVAVLNKGGSPRLMLAAHADEIAMTVNYLDDTGYLYVRKLGGID